MVKKIFYIFLSFIVLIAVYLTVFEVLLYTFHSPFNREIVNQSAHDTTWRYLIYQKYITFIDLDLFSIYEKRHLLDVKRVFQTTYTIWIVFSSLAFLILVIFFKKIANYIATLGFSLNILLLLISFNFLDSFKLFHSLFFKSNSWIFMKDSPLIEWFPLIYFQEFFFLFIVLSFFIFILFKVVSDLYD